MLRRQTEDGYAISTIISSDRQFEVWSLTDTDRGHRLTGQLVGNEGEWAPQAIQWSDRLTAMSVWLLANRRRVVDVLRNFHTSSRQNENVLPTYDAARLRSRGVSGCSQPHYSTVVDRQVSLN